MARTKLTAGRIAGFSVPDGKQQAFLWADDPRQLAVRANAGGRKAFIFQGRFENRDIRISIGSIDTWSIEEARQEARRIQRQIDQGRDPRQVKLEQTEADTVKRIEAKRLGTTLQDAWDTYVGARRSRWSDLHYRDHIALSQSGGAPRLRAKVKLTVAGPLAELMPMMLFQINEDVVTAWAEKEGAVRPARTRLALRLLKAFLRWCASEPEYRDGVNVSAASGKKARESAGTAAKKTTVLERSQLAPWFEGVMSLPNPVISTYLQVLLITGARRNELTFLQWADVDFRWKKIKIRDKVEGERNIPLTPYVASLLKQLPRYNEWVFWSDRSKSGRLIEPSIAHRQVCEAAGLSNITLQGMRRSFSTLDDWIDSPAGVVAQIMGHKPSATAEKHYKVRSIELLRKHHERIEGWILEQAGVEFQEPA